MTRFLETYAEDRRALLKLVDATDQAWQTFRKQAALDPESADETEGLISQELSAVRQMLAGHRFDVGLFGLIKRGKSTILNALLATEVSATSVTPETAVPVYVEHGDETRATVHFVDGRVEEMGVPESRHYTSQESNRNNQLGVTHVRVETPSPLLASGVRMIDTPGLDDAEADEVYTQRTIQELDSVDAGIIVVLSPPTIGGKEMAFLSDVVARNLQKILLVINMYPQHYYDEQTRQDIIDYVTAQVSDAGAGSVRIHPVCALDAWESRRVGFEQRWAESGGAALLDDLEAELSSGSGQGRMAAAATRLDSAVELAAQEVELRREFLSDPDNLAAYRDEMRTTIASFGDELVNQAEERLKRVEPLRIQHRSVLLSIFFGAKEQVRKTRNLEDLEHVLRRFRREAEVAGNHAIQQFRTTMGGILEQLEANLGERSDAVLAGLAADIETEAVGVGIFDEMRDDTGRTPTVGGAAFGGLVAGGVGFAVLGIALGPLGLIGGALVGWRLGDVVKSGRTIAKARELAVERLDAVADEFADEFDRQVDAFVDAVRETVRRRPAGLKADLETQLVAVERLTESPERLERRLAEYDRMLTAFGSLRKGIRRLMNEVEVTPQLHVVEDSAGDAETEAVSEDEQAMEDFEEIIAQDLPFEVEIAEETEDEPGPSDDEILSELQRLAQEHSDGQQRPEIVDDP